MDPTPEAPPPPGCLVLLLRLSEGMTADVVTGRGEAVAFAAVRQLADELMETLVYTAGNYSVGDIDVAVLGYRTDPDGTATFSVTQPTHGEVQQFNNRSANYLTSQNYCGPDSFTYTLSPGDLSATVSINVTCSDDGPHAVDDELVLDEDAGPTAVAVPITMKARSHQST